MITFCELRHSAEQAFPSRSTATCGRDDARGVEDNEVLFDVLIDVAAKGAADERNVANDRSFILGFLHVFPHQPTDNHGLSIINTNARRYFACAEYRLINHVRRQFNRC